MKDTKQRVTQKDMDKVHKENKLDKKLGTDRGYREKPQLYKTQPSPAPKSGGPFSKMEPLIKKSKEIVRSKAPEVLKKAGATAKRVASSPAMSTVKRVASSPFGKAAIGAARMSPLGRAATVAAGIGAVAYEAKKAYDAYDRNKKIIESAKSKKAESEPLKGEAYLPLSRPKVSPAPKKSPRPPQISGKEKILLDSLAEATGKGPKPYRPSKDKKEEK